MFNSCRLSGGCRLTSAKKASIVWLNRSCLPLPCGFLGFGIDQPDTKQIAGALHHACSVLRPIVKIESPWKPKFQHGFLQGVFYNTLLHRPVKLTVENVSGSIVNQAGEVGLCLYTAKIEHKSIFNISLPQVMPVQPLKSLGSVPFVIVKLHHCGGIPCTAQSILQCGSLQKSGRSLLLQLQDFNNCRDAPAGKFPA